jgi:hypothetical protein
MQSQCYAQSPRRIPRRDLKLSKRRRLARRNEQTSMRVKFAIQEIFAGIKSIWSTICFDSKLNVITPAMNRNKVKRYL